MKEIVLSRIHFKCPNYKKYVTLVDDDDFEKVDKYNWYVLITRCNIYAARYFNNKIVLLHTFLTGYKQTDHKDGNGLNNQRNNLREATYSQNNMNKKKKSGFSSKYKGVSWHAARNNWRAQINHTESRRYLGSFKSEEEAARAYNLAAAKYFGEFAVLNDVY